MMRTLYLLITVLLLVLPMRAQTTFSGVVMNEKGKKLPNVLVKAFTQHQKLKKYALSNRQGEFKLLLEDKDSIDILTLSRLGYETMTILRKDIGKSKQFVLHDEAVKIKDVVVRATPIREKGDTLTYNVASFMKGNDRTIEDVIKRLPGIRVDKTGSIYYQGEPINKFYIENMDMLSGNYKLATQNINADEIATVSVYQNHQPVRALKDFSFSDNAALNLKLKNSSKLKPIGYFLQGGGYDDHILWQSDLFAMQVGKKTQHLLSLKANDMGDTYNTSLSYDVDQVTDFSSFTWKGISLSAQDVPDIALDRYLNNKSGDASLNSLFKLRDKQTLTFNLRYSGDDIHYVNHKISSIFAGDNQYEDVSEKVQAAVYSNRLMGKIKFENNMDKAYFLDNLTFNANFYHKRFGLEDNFDGTQKQKSGNYQLTNQLAFICRLGKRMLQFQSNVRFSNTPVNSLQVFTKDNTRQIFQTLQETVFQTDEHTAFAWQLGRWLQAGIRMDFESNYNKISLLRLHVGDNLNNTFSGYMLNTGMGPYLRLNLDRLTWELNVPISLINVDFENAGMESDFKLNKVYAHVNTSVSWQIVRGLKMRLSGGSRYRFGNISNFVTSPIYYTYKDITTQGTGVFTNEKVLFVNGNFDYHSVVNGLFASLMASFSRRRINSMSQTSVSNGSVHKDVLDKSNNLIEKRLTFNGSKKFRMTDTSVSLMTSLGSSNTNIMSRNLVLKLVNDNYILTTSVAQTLWSDKLNLSLDYSFFLSQNKVQAVTTKMLNNQMSLGLSFFCMKDLELFGRINVNWLNEVNYFKRESYVSLGIRYKMKKWEIECLAQNLTNEKRYVVSKQNEESNYTYVYYLRPMSCSISVRYNF